MTPERFTYGAHPHQWADLYRHAEVSTGVASRGVVMVIHGGFWRARYDATLGAPLAEDLASRGWTAWNVEYRRVGADGGWPATFDDIAAGIDKLADVPELDSGRVVTLGHSAGGHLAAWAAARGRFERWQPGLVPVTGVVAQAGVLDLAAAHVEHLGSGAVQAFLGHAPDDSCDSSEAVDPRRQIPLEVPVVCLHSRADDEVPISQSQRYVEAARAAGGTASLVETTGDHYTLIDPAHDDWTRTVEALECLDSPR